MTNEERSKLTNQYMEEHAYEYVKCTKLSANISPQQCLINSARAYNDLVAQNKQRDVWVSSSSKPRNRNSILELNLKLSGSSVCLKCDRFVEPDEDTMEKCKPKCRVLFKRQPRETTQKEKKQADLPGTSPI
jgi:hypothetical protein